MVEISEVTMDEEPPQQQSQQAVAAGSRSQERLSDADEIECALLAHLTRPSARLHIENLITKLRKEGQALQRVAAASDMEMDTNTNNNSLDHDDNGKDLPKASTAPLRTPTSSVAPQTNSSSKYRSFPTYYFDAGKYNSPIVTIYVPLDHIGSHDKSKIVCHFTPTSFDLIVSSFPDCSTNELVDYRLINDNLEHNIDPSTSKYLIKSNKIILKLGKIKGEYSYDSWSQLSAKKKKTDGIKKEDPAAGIMDLMKDMYDSGDDNMKKMIGETMYKQRMGQLNNTDPLRGGKDDFMGGMDDF